MMLQKPLLCQKFQKLIPYPTLQAVNLAYGELDQHQI